MIDKPRSPGDLEVSEPTRTLLIELRQASGQTARPELELERVREVEAAVGMHLPDDLLALFAASIPRVERGFAMALGMVIGHTGALRDHRARGDLVGVGQAERRVYLCLDKGARSTHEARLLRYDVDDKTSEGILLADWLRALREELGRPEQPTLEAELTPCLIQPMPESSMQGRRVRHQKFGEGKALREIGTGPTRKVQVDFPGLGLKLMQARFLEFLD